MNKILAKTIPEESLESHLANSIKIWKILKEKHSNFIENEEFWKNSYLSVVFHDFGKLSDNFQNTLNQTKGSKENHIRHELLSGVYLYLNESNKDELKLWILAVLSHHKKFSEDGMIKSFKDNANKDLIIGENNIKQITTFIQNISKENKINYSINSKLNNYFLNTNLRTIYSYFDYLLNDNKKRIKERDRKDYLMYKAILNISDWIASGDKKYVNGIEYNEEFLKYKIIEKLKTEGKNVIAKDFKFKKFQLESNLEENIIAIAPTGSGKTEASLLWASNKKENERIIYLLPTRVTSNAIYRRLTEYFEEKNTAIVHSSALFFRKEINERYEKSDYLKDKTFFRNINVCTVDQILTQGFNLGFWEIKTFNMINSKVIIDEIHLYQPYTLGLIISSIKYLKEKFGVKFFIMSATMPEQMRNLLFKALEGDVKLIQDRELLNEKRNRFEIRETLFEGIENEVLENIKKRKKILIVVNTVNEAIKIYKRFKKFEEENYKIICYHSRFMQKDRISKENKILDFEKTNEPILLISTQVVEVSLDIDFDVLYTENAPIDAIIQRAGRVNRKRYKESTKVIIFKHTDITAEYVYKESDILKNTFELFKKYNGNSLSEEELIRFVDVVYKNFEIEKNESFIEGVNKYRDVQKKLSFIMDNSGDMEVFTRENLDTENIIPFEFWDELENKQIEEIVKYEITIRRKKRKYEEREGFKYLIEGKYSYETGLEFNDDDKVMIF